MNERKKLSDILHGNSREDIAKAWDETTAAAEMGPIPAGIYIAEVHTGELFKARTETPGYKITFRVCEGDFRDRRVWHDLWLTGAALPLAKRDLAKLGITRLAQLETPPPKGIICKVRVALRKENNGTERNEVRSFEFLRTEKPKADPFDRDEERPKGETEEPPAGNGSLPFDLDRSGNSTGPYGKGL